jgi:hypothetical protein
MTTPPVVANIGLKTAQKKRMAEVVDILMDHIKDPKKNTDSAKIFDVFYHVISHNVREFFDDALAEITRKRIQIEILNEQSDKRKPTPEEIRKYGLKGARARIEKKAAAYSDTIKQLESEIEKQSEELVKALRPHAERFLLNLIYLPIDYYPYAKKHLAIVQKYLPFNGDDDESRQKRAAMAASNVDTESGYSDNDYRVLLGILPEEGDTIDPAHQSILRGSTTVGRDDQHQEPVQKYLFQRGKYKSAGVLPTVHIVKNPERLKNLDFETRIQRYVTKHLSFRSDDAKKKFYAKMIRFLNESKSEANNRRAIYLATRIGLLSKNKQDNEWAEHYSKFTSWRDGPNRFRSEVHYTPNIPVIKNILAGRLNHITEGFDFNELKSADTLTREEMRDRNQRRRELEKDMEVRPRIVGGIAGRKLIGTPKVYTTAPGKQAPELSKEVPELKM